jgi:aspartate/glutamate racemase
MSQSILIIGGMGPQASLELHRRIIQAATENGVVNGHEYPEIVHASLAINDFISSQETSSALSYINRALEQFYLWRRTDAVRNLGL